jgi:AcrR family transcriptional regulator
MATFHDIQVLVRSHAQRSELAQSTRARLLAVGLARVQEQGWAATGLDALLRECAVPKGSFYHYFASKEAFGYAMLESYQTSYLERLERYWGAGNGPMDAAALRHAVLGWAQEMVELMRAHGYRRGCLVGALGQELAATHPGFRERLQSCLLGWQQSLSQALQRTAQIAISTSNQARTNSKTTGLEPLNPDSAVAPSRHAQRSKTSAAPALPQDPAAFHGAWAQAFWVQWQGAVLHAVLHQDAAMMQTVVVDWLDRWEHAVAELARLPVELGKTAAKPAQEKPVKAAKSPPAVDNLQSQLDF